MARLGWAQVPALWATIEEIEDDEISKTASYVARLERAVGKRGPENDGLRNELSILERNRSIEDRPAMSKSNDDIARLRECFLRRARTEYETMSTPERAQRLIIAQNDVLLVRLSKLLTEKK